MSKKRRLKRDKIKTVERRLVVPAVGVPISHKTPLAVGYDHQLVTRDLIKTVLLSTLIVSLEIAIYFYLY